MTPGQGNGKLERAAAGSLHADPIAQALFHDAGCAVAVLDERGAVLGCNGAFAGLLGGGSPGDLRAVCFVERLCGDTAEIHRQAHRDALVSATPVVVERLLGAMPARTTYRRLDGADPPRVLVVAARWRPDRSPSQDDPQHACNNSDPLAPLTSRELEVLAAIGRGLSTAEIAEQLNRSPKTVEGHRVSLGIKLGVTNRVQLARIAIRGGLAPLGDCLLESKPERTPPSTGSEE